MLCEICNKHEVLSTEGPKHCLDCRMRGLNFEFFLLSEERSNVLGQIRELDNVLSANVWHLGSGQYALGVIMLDGRLVQPGVFFKQEDDTFIIPAIPPLGVAWGVKIIQPRPADDEWMDGIPETVDEQFDDEELVEFVANLAFPSLV